MTLSREIASTLGGRYMLKEVSPFDFAEYLKYKGIEMTDHWELSPMRADVVRDRNISMEEDMQRVLT